jgi:GTP-binding protein Era
MMNIVYSSLETSDLICLLTDAAQRFGHGDQFVIDTLEKISTPLILLINKVDIVRKDRVLPIIDRYKDLLDFKEIIPISALKGTNVDVFEEKIYEYLPEAEKIFSDDEISTQSLKFLLSEIIREKLLHHVREELPFVTAVYIERIESDSPASPKKKGRTYIKATIFVEKDTHRGIIVGRKGQMIKTIGMEARREMEQILKSRIFLDLGVKVKERWRDSAHVLDLIEGQKESV